MSTSREVTEAAVRAIKPGKRNARTHSKKQILQVVELVRRYGWTYPILVDETGYIIAGYARYEAARHLRLTRVPVIVMNGLSDPEKRALAIADNKVPANAGWDRAILTEELAALGQSLSDVSDLDIAITGFEPAEIDSLMGDLTDPEGESDDQVPRPGRITVSKTGDLWSLGPHWLLCGDAQRLTDAQRLMRGGQASMVITDPPYNMKISSVVGRGRIKHRNFAMGAGEQNAEQFTAFLKACLSVAAECSVAGSIHFVFMDWRHIGELLVAGHDVYSELKNLVVWNKTNAGQGSFYRSQHELVFVWKHGEAPHTNNFELGQYGRNRSNVWTYAGVNTFRAGRLDDLGAHPTVKPTALIADAIKDCSKRGEIVFDPFMGSGTTILAAERVGRRAYGLEIDPLYVDVTVRRWQAYTGRDAVLAETGQTFDEVARAPQDAPAKRRRAK